MSDSWGHDPEVDEWAQRVHDELVPMIADSAVFATIVPGDDIDVKIAVEIGVAVLLDKPIIAIIYPGRVPSPALLRVADRTFNMPDPPTARAMDEFKALIDQVAHEHEAAR